MANEEKRYDTVEQGLDIMVKAVNVVQNTDHTSLLLPTAAVETKFNNGWYNNFFDEEFISSVASIDDFEQGEYNNNESNFEQDNKMRLRCEKETIDVQIIARDIIPRNSLQQYHTPLSKGESPNRSKVDDELEQMKTFKRDVKGQARIEIKKIMVQAAKNTNMRRFDAEKVQTYREICNVWKYWNMNNDPHLPMKMFYVMYGWFDQNLDWSKQLETKYMFDNNMKYQKSKGQKKETKHKEKLDAVRMLFTIVKNDHVKMINKRSLATHNMKITKTIRDGSGKNSESKRKRRKKGKYQDSILTFHCTIKNIKKENHKISVPKNIKQNKEQDDQKQESFNTLPVEVEFGTINNNGERLEDMKEHQLPRPGEADDITIHEDYGEEYNSALVFEEDDSSEIADKMTESFEDENIVENTTEQLQHGNIDNKNEENHNLNIAESNKSIINNNNTESKSIKNNRKSLENLKKSFQTQAAEKQREHDQEIIKIAAIKKKVGVKQNSNIKTKENKKFPKEKKIRERKRVIPKKEW